MAGWHGRTYDLGRMSLRDLLATYARHPAILVYAALALLAAALAAAWTENGVRTTLAALVLVALYPFVEYALHRFLLHGRFLYKSRLTAALWKRIHFDHHQDPHRLEVLFGSLATTLPLIAAIALPVGWAVDGRAGAAAALACATVLMCVYEFCHCVQHLNVKPRNRLLLRIKQLHLAHHFHDETVNFGITTPLVDRLAGTRRADPQGHPRSPTVFNLGYDATEAARYPWVAALTGASPRDRPDAGTTPAVEIRPVAGRADLDRFIRLPFALHRGDPAWVPPLLMERRAALSTAKNPYFRHAEAAFWIARRGGRDVGRVSAQIDRLATPGTGHFGLLAAVDDASVVAALMEMAERWLRARGAARAIGPFNLSINEETGLLVDGFDTPPMLMMGHDRPHLGPLLERTGYAKAKDLLAYISEGPELPAGVRALLARPLPPNVRVRRLRMADYRREVEALTAIFNDAWSGNWGFVPLTDAEIDHMARQMKPLIDERLVWFAEVDGEPAAFAVCLPNLNEAIRDLHGRLLPFGWAKLLWRLKVAGVHGARVPLMGVRRKHAGSLLGGLLAFQIIAAVRREAADLGLHRIEMSWILEDNLPMRRIAEAVGGCPYKTYRLYGKNL